jgi:hypothetical protein
VLASVGSAWAARSIISLAQSQAINRQSCPISIDARIKSSVGRIDDRVLETGFRGVPLWIGPVSEDSVYSIGVVHREVEAWFSLEMSRAHP